MRGVLVLRSCLNVLGMLAVLLITVTIAHATLGLGEQPEWAKRNATMPVEAHHHD